jgi:hypothetical protein
MSICYLLWPFVILCPFWYFISVKIWQPCTGAKSRITRSNYRIKSADCSVDAQIGFSCLVVRKKSSQEVDKKCETSHSSKRDSINLLCTCNMDVCCYFTHLRRRVWNAPMYWQAVLCSEFLFQFFEGIVYEITLIENNLLFFCRKEFNFLDREWHPRKRHQRAVIYCQFSWMLNMEALTSQSNYCNYHSR